MCCFIALCKYEFRNSTWTCTISTNAVLKHSLLVSNILLSLDGLTKTHLKTNRIVLSSTKRLCYWVYWLHLVVPTTKVANRQPRWLTVLQTKYKILVRRWICTNLALCYLQVCGCWGELKYIALLKTIRYKAYTTWLKCLKTHRVDSKTVADRNNRNVRLVNICKNHNKYSLN